jgi:hypothetical protein
MPVSALAGAVARRAIACLILAGAAAVVQHSSTRHRLPGQYRSIRSRVQPSM